MLWSLIIIAKNKQSMLNYDTGIEFIENETIINIWAVIDIELYSMVY